MIFSLVKSFMRAISPSKEKAKDSNSETGLQPVVHEDEQTNTRSVLYLMPKIITEQGKPFRPEEWSIDNFQIGRHIGKGKYGHVYLARQRRSGHVVALKVLSKRQLVNEDVIGQVRREIQIHTHLRHENILKMFGFFFDQKRIYIILEYAAGGELYSVLQQEGRLSERRAAIYTAQMLKAMQYLHSLNIIHRDLKPQNILVCNNDVVKLSDFGWAVHTTKQRKTFCGTIDYIGPEIIVRTPYDTRLDLWTIGVLAYELNAGRAPFSSDTRTETARKIHNLEFSIPEHFSPELSDFVRKMLVESNQRMSEQDALNHPYIKAYYP